MHLRRHILLAAALTAIAAGSAQACPEHATKHSTRSASVETPSHARASAVVAWRPRAWAPAASTAPRSLGLRVAIDPVDGTLGMPPADELSQQAMIGDDTPVQMTRAADGTVTALLDDRWAEFVMATLGPDGKPGWVCVQGSQGATRFMKRPIAPVLPAAPKWEDK